MHQISEYQEKENIMMNMLQVFNTITHSFFHTVRSMCLDNIQPLSSI